MKRTAPPPGPVRNIEFPSVVCQVLANGLTVLVVEDPYIPMVSAQLAFSVGRASSPTEHLGLTDLAVELLKEGSRRRTALEIADFLDRWGIDYGTEVYMEHSLVEVTVLKDFLPAGLELLAELVREPDFPESELEKVKLRWRSHLAAQRSDPGFLAEERTSQELFPDHPYAKVSIPPEHLDKTDRHALKNFYRNHFSPRGAFLLLAGCVTRDRALGLAGRLFEGWETEAQPELNLNQAARESESSICLVHRPHSVQSHVVVGTRTIPRAHPDTIPLKVMNQIFGGSASARLFLNLREEKGYTYGAYSSLKSYRHDGALVAGAGVRTEVTLETVDQMFHEMRKMNFSPADRQELERSQSELIGSFIRRMETPGSIASQEFVRRLYQLPQDYYTTYIPAIRQVDQKKVAELAGLFLNPERCIVTVVADRSLVEKELRQRGTLKVYDTNGNFLEQV